MPYYKDLREYIQTLDDAGQLVRIKRPINKDTELMALVRLQFRGLPEEQRKAFLFENVIDSRGTKYCGSVAVAALAGTAKIYAIGVRCQEEKIMEKLAQAEANPIEPRLVSRGAVQEEVHIGDSLMQHGAVDEFPVPISSPGLDAGPCFTAPFWITRDPDSGVSNVGTYRVMPKSPTRVGVDWANVTRGGASHWLKYRKRGVPCPAALVIGGPPSMGYVSVTTYPTAVNELAVAGGIAGEPLEVVKCKTVDLEVPAHAEIVIEGEIDTREMEPEGGFGESIGLMSLTQFRPFFTAKCITHRKNPVLLSFISQFQPSESSKIKLFGAEATVYKTLRYDLGMDFVQAVAFNETSDTSMFVIQVKRTTQENVWRALEASAKRHQYSKMIIAVDDFVDPHDLDMVFWQVTHFSQPHRDTRIVTRPSPILLDCSLAPMPELESLRLARDPKMPDSSILLINGTMKWPYPPLSQPSKEFMERAIEIWEDEGLPPLRLKDPWWGVELGYWSDEDREKAARAVKGEYYKTGEIQGKQRRLIEGGLW